MIQTVGIVGYGHFGQFLHELCERFFPEITIRVYSRRGVVGTENFCSLEATAASDVVILCGAIKDYEAQLLSVLQHALPQSIIVDVATVKKYTSGLLQKHCQNRRFISTHPMFGPESYRKHNQDVTGFRIVLAESTLSEDELHALRNLCASLGFLIIEMSADEHDERLAETLFLTHYVGQSVLKAGFGRTAIDTLSFQFLMDAVESVKHDKALFTDVYRFNPYCEAVAKRLHAAQKEVFSEL